MISERAREVLRRTSLFAGFSDEQLEVVPKVAIPREFAPGDVVVHEGTAGARSLFLLLEGEMEVRVAGEVIRVLGPGTHFGEMALLTDAPRSADVVARTPATALELSHRHLEGLIAANPQVAVDMLAELARRLREATEELAEVIRSSPEAAAVAARRIGPDAAAPETVDLDPIERVLERVDPDER